ncbi:unnamed protein product [Ectocarpus sp. 4 AP-2014]
MTAKPPAFLHRSFQHEVLLESCSFTSIAVVDEPSEPDATSTVAKKKVKRRWLVFVDRRRGLLGSMMLSCPTRVDQLPGRRRSYHFPVRPAPIAVVLSIPGSKPTVPTGCGDVLPAHGSQGVTAQRQTEHQSGSTSASNARADDSRKGRRNSLPLSTGNRMADVDDAVAWPTLVVENITGQVGEHPPEDGLTNVVVEGSQTASPEKQEDQYDGRICRHRTEPVVKILLSGLNRPILVAAATTTRTGRGVFFIEQASPAVAVDCSSSSKGTTTTQQPPEHSANWKFREEQVNQERASRNRPPPPRTWQLRFLRWGAKQAVTLVENFCKPIALCIGGADSSVFVLEEVHKRRHCDNDPDQAKNLSGSQQHLYRRPKRYRVRFLRGSHLSAWLSNEEAKRRRFASGEEGATSHRHDRQTGGIGTQLDAKQKPIPVGTSAYGLSFLNDESDTDWGSSSDDSEDGDFDNHDNQEVAGVSIGARVEENRSERSVRSRRRRGMVDFVEILAFQSPSAPKKGGERHREQPVGLCVLRDGTVVVAFSRPCPLHGGASVAKSQGVIRAFPANEMDVDRFPRTALSTNTADETLSTRHVAPPSYSTEDSWLVAEGLPVITGLVAGAGDAVYMSLCGASHDGTVTSIGSLSTRKRCRVPQVDPRREDFTSRAACEKRERVSSAGRNKHAGATWGDGLGDSHSERKLTRLSSGFAATLAVDDDMNLFYITAERTGTCRALWCSVAGAGSRRVSSIRENFSTVRITAAGVPPNKTAHVPAAIGRAERGIVSGDRSIESGGGNTGRAKDQTAQAAAAAAAAVAAAVATKRAAALSSALAEDDEAVLASSPGRKSLFASRRRSAADEEYTDGDDGSGVGQEESNAPVNIAVVSRCRPLLTREMKRGVRAAVFCDGNEIVVLDERLPTKRSRRFGFDRVFGPRTNQARLYSEAVYPVVRKMLDGFNCSVLAYGQTGSGKTFTMEGGLVDPNIDVKETAEADPDDDDATACEVEKVGIIPRAVHTIFREGGCDGTRRYWVYVSHMEIYNERLFDLLAPEAASLAKASPTNSSAVPSSTSGRSRSPTHRSPRITPGSSGSRPPQGIGLTIEEDRHLGVTVKGLTQVEVKSPEEIFAIIARSKNNRRTAETMCNVESSRSHGVFCVRVISAEPTPWGGEITRDGRLSLVDLSGSENIKRSGAVGDRAKEAAAIGQSLLALGRVIKALVKHAPHIPYRESKLTRVLGDSLGGNAFTAIILNITPNNGMLEETLNTLTYAKTAQSVRNTPKQHIANKTPMEKATIGTGDSSHLAPSSGVQNLSCNMVNELKRWRGDVKSRLLSSGSSRGAYISPWESQVPIDAPSHFSSTAGGRSSNTDGPSHQLHHNQSVLSSQPFADVPSNQQGSDCGIAGDEIRKQVDRRRGVPVPSIPARVEFSLEDQGRRRSGSDTSLLSPAETAGASGVTPRPGWRGGVAPTRTAGARDGLVSDSLERRPSTTRPEYLQHDRISLRGSRSSEPGAGGRSGRKVTRRVFDSAAAEWVQNAVLEHTVSPRVDRPRQKSFIAERARRAKKGHISFTTEDDGGVSLTAEAKRAVEEVFDRYVPSGKPGRAFLLSAEVSTLQEIWTRPNAEPPPPRLSPPPKRALRKITQPPGLSPNRGSAAFGLPEMSDNEVLGTKVLTREAFVEFCRRAATRDAIFIRHFFVRSGYDCRLEAPPTPLGDEGDPLSPAWRPSPQRKRSTIVARRKSKDGATIRTHDSVEAVGSPPTSGRGRHEGSSRTVSRRHGSLRGGREKREMPTSHSAARPKEQESFENETDDIGCLTSGGIVDAAELWLWMEDGRDHGERSRLDGLLSRGGGAHVSRSGVTAVVDKFSGTKCHNSSTTATTPVSCPKDQNRDVPLHAAVPCPAMDESIAAGETSATVPLDKTSGPELGRTPTGHTAAGNGKISRSDMAYDAANSATISPENHWEVTAKAPLPEVAKCAGRLAGSSSVMNAETRSTICKWCGKSLTAAAVHSAAFCDFDDLR